MKKISVVIPYFNSHQYFPETLASVIYQSYPDIEIIIVDDKSTSDSVKRLTNEIKKFESDREIKVIRHDKNMGVAESRNTGLKAAMGEYVLFIDADDTICGKYSLEFRADFLNTHTDFDATGGYSLRMDTHSAILEKQTQPSDFFRRAVEHPDTLLREYCIYSLKYSKVTVRVFFLITGSCLLRKESINDILFDPHFDSEDDVEWTLRFLQAGKRIQLHKVPFHFWRIHDKQYHLSTPPLMSQEILTKMKELS